MYATPSQRVCFAKKLNVSALFVSLTPDNIQEEVVKKRDRTKYAEIVLYRSSPAV